MVHEKTDLILSIDAGTQSFKACLVDLHGKIVAIEKNEIEAYFSKKPNYAEQSPLYFKEKLFETTRRLLHKHKDLLPRIKSVALTTQRCTVINLDKNGNPLRDAIVWPDQRQVKLSGKYPKMKDRLLLRMVNMYEAGTYAMKNSECHWIMQNEPEIWEKTDKFLYLSGYFSWLLTGEFVDSSGNIVGYMPFDYKKQQWASKKHFNTKMFPIEKEKLPRLCASSEILGYITKEASGLSGIPEGLPLIAGASDKASEVLGSGIFEPGTACLSFGTTATVQVTIAEYKEAIPFFPPYPSVIPNFYNPEIAIFRGFWMVKWFAKHFGSKEVQKAEKEGLPAEKLLDELINEVEPGSMGLMLQPYWSPGIKVPGIEAKGAIIGFGDVHTNAHVYRAMIEGLIYSLKEGMLRIEKRTRAKINQVMVAGGGSQNDNIVQMTCDIFNLPTSKPHTFEASALGAAVNAAKGMGYFSSYKDAVKSMCHLEQTFFPNPKNSSIYNEYFERVYLKMYSRLQKLYEEIRDIADYPRKG